MPKQITSKAPAAPPPTRAQGMARGAAAAERYTPETAVDGVTEVLPRLPPSPPFFFAWHPARWVVLDGKVVPSLRKVRLQPGVNHVTRRKGRDGKPGAYRVGRLRAHLEERGWTLIPYDRGPAGSYIHRVRTGLGPEGSYAHLSVWESAYPGTDAVGADAAGYATWCASLVEDGTVPPCPPYVADRLRDRHGATLAAYEEKISRGGVSYRPHADRLREDIGALDDYLGAALDGAGPVATEAAVVEVE
jgi:hypothetical protein